MRGVVAKRPQILRCWRRQIFDLTKMTASNRSLFAYFVFARGGEGVGLLLSLPSLVCKQKFEGGIPGIANPFKIGLAIIVAMG